MTPSDEPRPHQARHAARPDDEPDVPATDATAPPGPPPPGPPPAGLPSREHPPTTGTMPVLVPPPAVDGVEEPVDVEDPFAPYRPTGPTLQPDPAALQYDEPLDTAQLQQLPTGQLLIVHRPDLQADVAADEVEGDTQRRVYSWVGVVLGVLGAVCSLFVGWMLPVSVAAIVFGVLGLRREKEHGTTLPYVAIGAGVTGLVFSAVWIGYYAIVFGALPT